MKVKDFNLQFRVGLFIFLGLIIFFVFVFSQGKILRGKGYDIKVVYNYVGGLDPGAPVRVSGYRVGEVRNIELLLEKDRPRIVVTIRIKPEIRLGRHSRFLVRNYGIIGEKYLEILATGLTDTPLIEPGETVSGEDPLPIERFLSAGEDILRNLNTLLADLNKLTSDQELKKKIHNVIESTNNVLSKASETLESFSLLASNWTKTSIEINQTVSEIKPDLTQLISSANESSTELSRILKENSSKIDNIISNLEKTSVYLESNIPEISDEIKNVSRTLKQAGDGINNLVKEIESSSLFSEILSDRELAGEIKDTITALKQTATVINLAFIKLASISDQISSVVMDVKAGKGTVGKLITDDELYNQATDMIKDLRANPWKLLFRSRSEKR